MSDTAAEVKDTKTPTTPEKEKDLEKKTTEEKVGKETNGESKTETNDTSKKNGVEKEAEKDEKPVENGDSKEEEVVTQKRKSDVGGGDATDSGSPAEGISPEKKAKLEEKVENGEAEATA